MRRDFEVHSSRVVLAGLTWTEHYGCYSTKVGGFLALAFHWAATMAPKGSTENGFTITVGGVTLKKRGISVEDAANVALSAAKKLLATATAELVDKRSTYDD